MSKSKKPVIDDQSRVVDGVDDVDTIKTPETKEERSVTKGFTRNTKLKKVGSGKLSDIVQTECIEEDKKNRNAVSSDTKEETKMSDTKEETKLIDNVFTHENGKTYYNNTGYKLSLKKSKIKGAGLGVFAEENIPKGEHIGNYDGKIIQRKKKHFDPDYSMEINEKYVVDGSCYPRPLTSMINDTYKTKKKHNCEFVVKESKKRVEVYSTRSIADGDELYIDYGNEYWTSRSL
jgi:hypothetical protein